MSPSRPLAAVGALPLRPSCAVVVAHKQAAVVVVEAQSLLAMVAAVAVAAPAARCLTYSELLLLDR